MPLADLMAEARARDAADPLAPFRARVIRPEGRIPLDGHSLGLLPRTTPARLARVAEEEWGQGLIASWNRAGWIEAPARIGARIAPLIGAAPEEVTVCDSVSVNLFKLAVAALRLRPGRRVLLLEAGDFPTDHHVAESAARLMGAEVRAVARDGIADALGPEVALLLLSHVSYRTAAVHDMAALTAAAHAAGALILWDLSHSTGAVEVDLGDADMAVGCGYKHLLGGPGAPAFAFVAWRHQAALDQPIAGWMGHAEPFAFEADYAPAPGVRRLLAGTPPILALAALEEGVALVAEAGPARLAAKARALGDVLIAGLEAIGCPDLRLVSPRTGRGAHVTFAHRHAWPLVRALDAAGVTGDFRAPDCVRLGVSPLGLSFMDVVRAAEILEEVLASGAHLRPEYRAVRAVT
ncbi:aminotransferase class V-fold PLP-dependent enzyme [Thermaurantiacus tibetensis]|uniref:aminotransferase class V-fold PLP-dependent enzyme n=1 Tax=Thermaurantiacus tibetensis TaxID=2759035 RepID=UPI00189099C8|nr:aminotransferase class V-fold PLP-dependent enzyme [Thermaurantiacus tibetensis]